MIGPLLVRFKRGVSFLRGGSPLGFESRKRAGSFANLVFLLLFFPGCALIATRPVQEMSDTAAAIKAAREVQADVLAPEFYREASEWFYKAKKEYKYKNFLLAKQYAQKARHFAEQAEFDSIRGGGNRADQSQTITDPFATGTEPQKPPPPVDQPPPQQQQPQPPQQAAPTPTGTPAEFYDQRKAEEDAAAAKAAAAAAPQPQPAAPTPPTIVPLPGVKP